MIAIFKLGDVGGTVWVANLCRQMSRALTAVPSNPVDTSLGNTAWGQMDKKCPLAWIPLQHPQRPGVRKLPARFCNSHQGCLRHILTMEGTQYRNPKPAPLELSRVRCARCWARGWTHLWPQAFPAVSGSPSLCQHTGPKEWPFRVSPQRHLV